MKKKVISIIGIILIVMIVSITTTYADNVLNDKPKKLKYKTNNYDQYNLEDFIDMN